MNSLACITKIEETERLTKIRPLPHMYVLKDLVPDLTHFFKQYRWKTTTTTLDVGFIWYKKTAQSPLNVFTG